MASAKKLLKIPCQTGRWLWQRFLAYWRSGWWHKMVVCGSVAALLCLSGMYSIALWYQHSVRSQPLALGVTFIPSYATYLGVDAHETYEAILTDLQPKQVRLVSYWNDIETAPGQYDFTELDYEMARAKAHDTKVTLSIGLRQPRWPECHAPSWIDTTKPLAAWEPQLQHYVTTVVERYRDNSALHSYQLENEYFNVFGQCHNFDRGRLKRELTLVKQLDPNHPVIMSRSNNYAGLSLRQPLPDVIGISIYRHVWNNVLLHRYLTYPFPSWYYAFLAGAEQLLADKPSVVHELQTEPWPPNGQNIPDISIAEQNKTFNADILQGTTRFAKQSGIRDIDLWGAEYWYYRMKVLNDPSVWNAAQDIFDEQ